MQVIEHLEEHYEVQEVPFGRVYKWCPESVEVQCDCGESTIFKTSTLTSSVVLCECGADCTADIQEERQRDQPEVLGQTQEDYETAHHPWLHDTQAQAEQHLRNEVAYSNDSSWRYDDE
jgi:hypothetical protein